MHVIAMPQLGETVTEGTILTWLKEPGEAVEVDDGLFEVSTEKVDTEVPSAVSGVLRVQLVDAGDTVPIGTPVAVITATADEPLDLAELAGTPASAAALPAAHRGAAGGVVGATAGSTADRTGDDGELVVTIGSVPGPESVAAQAPVAADQGPGPTASVDARPVGSSVLSPVVRRLLDEHGLAPDQVVGSGRDGRITRADVAAAAAAARQLQPGAGLPAAGPAAAGSAGATSGPDGPGGSDGPGGPGGSGDPGGSSGHDLPTGVPVPGRPAAPTRPPVVVGPRDEVVDFSRTRAATAAHMLESLGTAAHALVALTVDYSSIDAVRRPVGLSYLPFVARAVVEAIAEFPHLNASVVDDEVGQRLVVHRDVNLGIAVDVEQEALMVPVVHGADQMRIGALSEAMADLAERARRRRLAGEALSGGTFTITNVGAYGTLVTMPIINQPQVAILSTDGVRMTPVAVPLADDSWGIAVHPVGNLCLSFDHRAFDGAYAAAFLARVRSVLEDRDWASEVAP